jgi:signal transduction histidine kinase
METLTNSMSVALESARLFSQMERRAEQFRVLAEVGRHIISLTNVHELVEKIARTVKETFGYLHVGIGLVEGGFVVSKAEVGKFAENYQSEAIPFGQGVWGWVAQHGQALNTNLPVDAGLGILCHLCVPLKVKNQVIGVISAESDHVDAFDQSDETILQMVGNQASVAIENVRLYEQSKQLAVLEERQRLARELHDSVTQSLYGISLYAQAAAGNIHAGEIDQAAQYLDDIQNTSQESLADMRLLIYELKPPILDKEGLISALQNRLNSVEDRTRIKSSIQTNLTNRLPSDVEKGLYQIAREALNNIIKHAFAKHVSIRVHHEPASVLMEISDDGIGFDPQNASREGCLGLINMREHAQSQGWRLDIESKPGNGTCIKVKVGQNG